MKTLLNFPLIAAILAIVVAQLLKYPVARLTHKEGADISIIYSTGGMPSSHSAAAAALILALIIKEGLSSSYVAIAVTYGLIIMFDAAGVRRQSGEQGLAFRKLLNLIKKQAKEKKDQETLDNLNELHLNDFVITDYLGHRPSEVLAGALTGVLVTILVCFFFKLMEWPL